MYSVMYLLWSVLFCVLYCMVFCIYYVVFYVFFVFSAEFYVFCVDVLCTEGGSWEKGFGGGLSQSQAAHGGSQGQVRWSFLPSTTFHKDQSPSCRVALSLKTSHSHLQLGYPLPKDQISLSSGIALSQRTDSHFHAQHASPQRPGTVTFKPKCNHFTMCSVSPIRNSMLSLCWQKMKLGPISMLAKCKQTAWNRYFHQQNHSSK